MIRVVGVTSGSSLKVYLQLAEMLSGKMDFVWAGLYASDSLYYFSQQEIEVATLGSFEHYLFEWNLTKEARAKQSLSDADLSKLRKWESVYGDPVFWNALLADRRIYFGKKVKYRQDYRPRFSYGEMLSLLYVFIERIEQFFERANPDIVLSFGTATLGDYLFFLIARARGVGFLQLKGTKVDNFVSLNSDAIELSHHFLEAYQSPNLLSDDALSRADEYIEQTKISGLSYEGATQLIKIFSLRQSLRDIGAGIKGLIRRELNVVARRDNHVENFLMMSLHNTVINPLRAAWTNVRLGRFYVGASDLDSLGEFAFYPMHFEPEVAIQVYGRPFQNQIELIRAIAMALPVGMLLVVKEHPRSKGFRSWSYYKKLLEIPNVRIVQAEMRTRYVMEGAALVAVLSGSTGLEAAICGKPVITFGTPVINALPSGIIRHIGDMNELASDIQELLANYQYDHNPIRRFVASIIQGSVSVDLYTALLQKPDRQRIGREDVSECERRNADYEILATYCVSRIYDEIKRLS